MFQRALISTDFTDSLYRLGRVVPDLVASGLHQITFFHNVPLQTDRSIPKVDEAGMQHARDRLQQMIQAVPEGVTVDVSVASGRPSDNILKQVQSSAADVLFLGTPTRTALTEKLAGSTTMNLVERTPVPMMILRPQLISTYTIEELALRCRRLFRDLLVPYDGTPGADDFLASLHAHFQKNPPLPQQKLWLVWVIDENIRRELQGDHPLEEAEASLHKAAERLQSLGVTVEGRVREGDPLMEILKVAEMEDIGAIATCSRGIGGLLRWSVPSLTRDLLRQSWHPVLYFPRPPARN